MRNELGQELEGWESMILLQMYSCFFVVFLKCGAVLPVLPNACLRSAFSLDHILICVSRKRISFAPMLTNEPLQITRFQTLFNLCIYR